MCPPFDSKQSEHTGKVLKNPTTYNEFSLQLVSITLSTENLVLQTRDCSQNSFDLKTFFKIHSYCTVQKQK